MWRARGVLGVALAAALVAETFVATGEALAAPPVAPAQEEPTRGPNGLEAPDVASARTIAQLEGERVEVIGERTESSSTWAMPDGTMTTGQAAGPIWIRQGDGDGTTSADWAAVDLTLALDEDGNVAPKAHPAGLVLAGEGVPEGGALVSMQGPSGETVGLQWADALPVPTLEGPRAVYADVQPGVDLVVEATRTGYEQFFVLTERPGAGEVPELALTVVGEGLQAVPAADGGVEFTTPAGEVLGASGTPLVWDAAVDAERLHPITEPWAGEGEQAGVALPPVPDTLRRIWLVRHLTLLVGAGVIAVAVALPFLVSNTDATRLIAIMGFVIIGLSVVILSGMPGTAVWVLGVLAGINMLMMGFAIVMAAVAVRKAASA